MFENLAKRWQETRGTGLKAEFVDSVRRLNSLTKVDAERFGQGLSQSYRLWIEKNGPVKQSPESLRKPMTKEFILQARKCFRYDIGVSYALAFISFHLESSYLPGNDAAFVYETTGSYIAGAHELCKVMGKSSMLDVERHLKTMNYRLTPYGAGFVALSLAGGYSPGEVASRIVVLTSALDAKEAEKDLDKLAMSVFHAGEIIKILGELESIGQIRTDIAKHDTGAIWGIANLSVERKEWIETVLSDPSVGKERLAIRID